LTGNSRGISDIFIFLVALSLGRFAPVWVALLLFGSLTLLFGSLTLLFGSLCSCLGRFAPV